MVVYLLRRLGLSLAALFAVVTISFFVLWLTGDPVVAMLPEATSAERVEEVRRELGMDRPVLVQYLDFLAGIPQGDFGTSYRYGQPVMPLVMERLPKTLLLAGFAWIAAALVGTPLGIIAAVWPGTWIDRTIQTVVAIAQAIPTFVAGPLLILVFAVWLGLFPVAGSGSAVALILPATTLGLHTACRVARVLRVSMLDVKSADYVTMARAKGVGERRVVLRHVTRNALLPVITVLGLQLGQLLGGAVVVEAVFGWPGVGSLAQHALLSSDFTIVRATIIVVAAAVIVINFLTDLSYKLADPRIELR